MYEELVREITQEELEKHIKPVVKDDKQNDK